MCWTRSAKIYSNTRAVISQHVREQIIAAVKAAVTIDPATQTRIANELA
jgi:hypothetical protein